MDVQLWLILASELWWVFTAIVQQSRALVCSFFSLLIDHFSWVDQRRQLVCKCSYWWIDYLDSDSVRLWLLLLKTVLLLNWIGRENSLPECWTFVMVSDEIDELFRCEPMLVIERFVDTLSFLLLDLFADVHSYAEWVFVDPVSLFALNPL